MGNSSSQQVPEDNPELLWVTPIATRSVNKYIERIEEPPDSTPIPDPTTRPDASHSVNNPPPTELKQLERRERKRRRRQRRELRRLLAEQQLSQEWEVPTSQDTPHQTDTGHDACYGGPDRIEEDDQGEEQEVELEILASRQKKSRCTLLDYGFDMEHDLPIDPSLREDEGTFHAAAPNLGVEEGRETTRNGMLKAPMANMGNFSQSDAYEGLGPLVQAVKQASLDEQRQAQAAAALAAANSKQRKSRKKKGAAMASDEIANGDAMLADGSTLAASKQRRKRKMPKSSELVDENGQLDPQGEGEERPKKKTRKISENINTEDLSQKEQEIRDAGPLSKFEWKLVEEALAHYRAEHDLDQSKVNDFVQSTNRAQSALVKELWSVLYEALPHRQRVAVMRACRRRYNNFEARGKWTLRDDDLLKQAYSEAPGKWVRIGSILERMPEDCRDRWRNYLSCGDQRKIDDWSEKEEMELSQAVLEVSEAAKQEARDKAKQEGHAFREQDWESYINFNTVSEKMGFTRSRLQCYTHWKVMQNRDLKPQRRDARRSDVMPNRQGRALSNFKKMKPGDKYQILCQIAESDPSSVSHYCILRYARQQD